NIDIVGLQMHIGSQIIETQPFVDAIKKIAPLVLELKAKYEIEFFSIGGGVGIVYESSFLSGSKDWWDLSTSSPQDESVRLADKSKNTEKIDIVGPVCETGDFFALDREMPEVRDGDLLAIMSAGAYGFVMASNYNSRPLPAEALVRGDKFALIRKRQTWEDLIR